MKQGKSAYRQLKEATEKLKETKIELEKMHVLLDLNARVIMLEQIVRSEAPTMKQKQVGFYVG